MAQDVPFNQTNPPIVARVGERLEVTVRNVEDRPIAHNFVVPALGGKSDYLQPGQNETVSFLAKREGPSSTHARCIQGRWTGWSSSKAGSKEVTV